ncbi:MAG: hypothetical protein RIS52_2359 [Pseudomonadota bacterium]
MANRGIRIIQNAWIVPNLDEAMDAWMTASGIGPFYVIRRLTRTMDMKIWLRGALQTSDSSVGYAQAGDLQIELIERHTNEFHQQGQGEPAKFHHISMWADDFDARCAAYRAVGREIMMEGVVGPEQTRFGYVDTISEMGGLTEFTERTKSMERLYEVVADGARDWDGSDPVRELTTWPT